MRRSPRRRFWPTGTCLSAAKPPITGKIWQRDTTSCEEDVQSCEGQNLLGRTWGWMDGWALIGRWKTSEESKSQLGIFVQPLLHDTNVLDCVKYFTYCVCKGGTCRELAKWSKISHKMHPFVWIVLLHKFCFAHQRRTIKCFSYKKKRINFWSVWVCVMCESGFLWWLKF